jgi:serine/threonine protein kinase
VRKAAYPDITRKESLRDIEHEYKIYQRLPSAHDRLLEMVRHSEEDGLILEYMPNGNLREYLRTNAADITLDQRLQWACDAAEALHLVHSYNVIHCDVKPQNFLLDSNLRLRIIDFSGSSIDGSYFSALESARFCLPRGWEVPSTVATDLFALGSTIYEIMTGTQPYAHCTDEEVEALFMEGTFPPVDGIACGELIKRCWHSEVQSAEEIRLSIKTEVQKIKGKSNFYNRISLILPQTDTTGEASTQLKH